MNVAIIEHFDGHGYEVWITDFVEIGAGLGDVFDTRDEAFDYAKEHNVPIVDLSYIQRSYLEGDALRTYMRQYLRISPVGYIEAIV